MDINAIKKRLTQLQTTNTRTSNLWKPQPGKTLIRIVPYKFNKQTPFIELFFHYDIGGKSYLSPISFGRPDPIEEFADKLKSSGNRDDWKLGKKLEAKMRTFTPVIVRGEEKEGVKFWGFGKTVYQELLSVISDPDYGDITDPLNGRDVNVEFKKPTIILIEGHYTLVNNIDKYIDFNVLLLSSKNLMELNLLLQII